MTNWKILIGALALTLFFLVAGLVRSFFQFPEDKVVGTSVMEGKMRTNEKHVPVNVLKFFHLEDGLEVRWVHAVNSQKRLQEALSGKAMMLEADVLLRPADGKPIMAHPPDTESDLSLEQFLKETIGTTKGIKVDFKSTAAIEPSLKILLDVTSGQELHNPVWFNADVIPGPCHQDTECNDAVIDPHVFLSLCAKYYPSAVLSVGWTTGEHIFVEKDFYEWHFVNPMKDLLSDVSQAITFPIRANMVGNSMEQITWLLSLSDQYMLTIWSTNFDEPNMKELVSLRNRVDKSRIFYDIPPDQEIKFMEELKHQN